MEHPSTQGGRHWCKESGAQGAVMAEVGWQSNEMEVRGTADVTERVAEVERRLKRTPS